MGLDELRWGSHAGGERTIGVSQVMKPNATNTGSFKRRVELPSNHIGIVERPAFCVLEYVVIISTLPQGRFVFG